MTLEEVAQAIVQFRKEMPSFEITFEVKLKNEILTPPTAHTEPPVAHIKHKDVAGIEHKYAKNCKYCNAEFATDIADREYCCRAHASAMVSNMPKPDKPVIIPPPPKTSFGQESYGESKNCIQCGKEFTPLKRLEKKAKFCSTKCREESYKNPLRAAMDKQRASFDDAWDCAMCANAGSLCTMHERMEANGKQPPKYRVYQ